MASQSNNFKNDNQEFEQGQIPSNNQGLSQLLRQRSADNQFLNKSKIVFNQKPNDPNKHKSQQSREFTQDSLRQKYARKNESGAATHNRLGRNDSYHQPATIGLQHGDQNNTNYGYSNHQNEFHQNSTAFAGDNFGYNRYSPNKNKNYVNSKQVQNLGTPYQFQDDKIFAHHNIKLQNQYNNIIPHNYSNNIKSKEFEQFKRQHSQTQPRTLQLVDPRKSTSFLAEKNRKALNSKINKQKEDKSIQEWMRQKAGIKAQIEKHRAYFREDDWQRLLFIIQEIILDNNIGIKRLWNFINKLENNKKLRKGRRIFQILEVLGLEQTFDKLILQENNFKKQRKQKETKIKSVVFALVRKID